MLSEALIEVTGEMSAGELIVGVGTLGLAFVTWLLARSTRREVSLSEKGLALTRDSIEALERPFLIAAEPFSFDYVPIFDRDGEEVGTEQGLMAVFENLGSGPAIFEGAEGTDASGRPLITHGWRRELLFKPGDTSTVGMELEQSKLPEEGDELTLVLKHRSASGALYHTTHTLEVESHNRLKRLDVRRSFAPE